MLPRIRVLDTRTCIAPFGDPVGEFPCLGRSFARLREEELEAERLDEAPLCFADHAFASGPLLAAFLRAAAGRPARLALPRGSPAIGPFAPVSSIQAEGEDLALDIFANSGARDLAELRALPRLRLEPKVATLRRELPRLGPPPHHLDLPAGGLVAAHVEHWVHVLWLWPLLVQRCLARGHPKRPAPYDLSPNLIGQGARVHPTAHVEGSVIGPNAEIGAFCSVRHSYVGAGSRLSDFTKVTHSVLEDRTHTLADASFAWVVSLGESTLASLLLRDSILGRQSFLTTGVIFWSDALEGNVHVEHRGAELDSGRRVLGGCAGHRASLGARTIVAPGRALPNGAVVVMRREEGVFRVEPVAPGRPVCWDDARLVPYEQLRPGELPDELA